jgi:hypothetical protein
MSKNKLLSVGNFNLFKNDNEQIEFNLAKDSKVKADYSAYDKEKGYGARGIRAKSKAGNGYIRLSISVNKDGGGLEFFNAALFSVKPEDKKSEKSPDFTGTINLDSQQGGPKLRLAAWKKSGEKAGGYLSVNISEFAQAPAVDEPKSAPVPEEVVQAPRRTPAPAASAAKAAPMKPAPAGFDDMDDDIPF